MESIQTRLDTFTRLNRVKSPKSAASISLKWPHPSHFKATPSSLAEAGFYFSPSWDDRDAVTCYMCSKSLSDWTKDDDPFEIHWSKCKKICPWAVVRCGLKDDMDDDENWVFSEVTRLPSGKTMEKARLDTFGNWPYDSERNHGATSKKMARAGFVYTPQSSSDDISDDTATCLYCNLSLSGWDADDDPLQEHRKREKKSGISCPFFSVTAVKSKAPPSRPSFKSTSRSKSTKIADEQSPLSASDDELASAVVLTGGKRSVRGKSVVPSIGSSADPLRMSTRRSTRVASGKTATSEAEDEGPGAEVEKAATKKRKGKEKKRVEVIEEEVEDELEPKKHTKKVASRTKQGADPPEPEITPALSVKEPSGKKAKGKKKTGSDSNIPTTNPPKPLTQSKTYPRLHVPPSSPVPPVVPTATKELSQRKMKGKKRSGSDSDIPTTNSPKPLTQSKSYPRLDSTSVPTGPASPKHSKPKKALVKVDSPVIPVKRAPDVDPRSTDIKVVDISTDDDGDDVAPPKAVVLPQDPTPPPKHLVATGKPPLLSLAVESVIPAPPPPKDKGKTVTAKVVEGGVLDSVPAQSTLPPKLEQQPVAPEPVSAPVSKPRIGKKTVAVEVVQPIEVVESLSEIQPVEPPVHPDPSASLRPSHVPSPPPIDTVDIDQATQPVEQPRTPPNPFAPRRPSPAPLATPVNTIDDLTFMNGIGTELFIPPLSIIPMAKIVAMTEHELDRTVEVWIRQEMAMQYEQFKGDGERAIEMFKQRTAEVRRTIETL